MSSTEPNGRRGEKKESLGADTTRSFPLFCEREIWVGWRDGSFPSGPSDYMSLICMCALSVQHVRNGTLFTDDISASECVSSSQDYIDEAVRLTPVDLGSADTNVIRSYGFLALLGAQTGNSAMTHRYLGLYHGLCAQFGLHDESRWPASISSCEREVRQRLWWAMYRLEVHTACVLGNLVHCSEAQCNVDYPMGLHHPAFLLGRDGPYEDWFAGWNLTTDLYRVLEHAIVDFRSKKTERPQGGSILGERARPPSAFIASKLAQTQAELLPHFRTAWTRSSDSGRNRCGFQALNILCTIHLARTIASISCEGGPQPACEMACQMMESIGSIPLEYVRALGLPFLQQLAGVGYMLVGVAHKYELSHVEYDRLRDVVTTIIQFLERLTDHNHVAANTVKRLVKRLKNLDRPSCSEVVSDAVDDSFGPKLLPDEIAYGIMYDQDAFPSALLDDYI